VKRDLFGVRDVREVFIGFGKRDAINEDAHWEARHPAKIDLLHQVSFLAKAFACVFLPVIDYVANSWEDINLFIAKVLEFFATIGTDGKMSMH